MGWWKSQTLRTRSVPGLERARRLPWQPAAILQLHYRPLVTQTSRLGCHNTPPPPISSRYSTTAHAHSIIESPWQHIWLHLLLYTESLSGEQPVFAFICFYEVIFFQEDFQFSKCSKKYSLGFYHFHNTEEYFTENKIQGWTVTKEITSVCSKRINLMSD